MSLCKVNKMDSYMIILSLYLHRTSMLIVCSGNIIYELLPSRYIKVSSWILNSATSYNLTFSYFFFSII